jgi:flagellar hook-length control protein FliK
MPAPTSTITSVMPAATIAGKAPAATSATDDGFEAVLQQSITDTTATPHANDTQDADTTSAQDVRDITSLAIAAQIAASPMQDTGAVVASQASSATALETATADTAPDGTQLLGFSANLTQFLLQGPNAEAGPAIAATAAPSTVSATQPGSLQNQHGTTDPADIAAALARLGASDDASLIIPPEELRVPQLQAEAPATPMLRTYDKASADKPPVIPDTPTAAPGIASTDTKSAVTAANPAGEQASRHQLQAQAGEPSRTPDLQAAAMPTAGTTSFSAELKQAQATPHAPQLTPHVPLDALAVQIARRAGQGLNRFEISLSPVELGKLEISMSVSDDGRVQAVLRAERPETLDMLRQDARTLETQLRQAGLDVGAGSLSFQLSQGNAQRNNTAANAAFASALARDGNTADETVTSYIARPRRDGLDIHV